MYISNITAIDTFVDSTVMNKILSNIGSPHSSLCTDVNIMAKGISVVPRVRIQEQAINIQIRLLEAIS